MKKTVNVERAAKPGGPYSHAVIANGFVYVSGQGPKNPQTNTIPQTLNEQVRQTLENVKVILEGAGVTMNDVIKVNAYLADLSYFNEFNEIYQEYFPSEPPTRTTIGAQLLNILVEIDCVAALPLDNMS